MKKSTYPKLSDLLKEYFEAQNLEEKVSGKVDTPTDSDVRKKMSSLPQKSDDKSDSNDDEKKSDEQALAKKETVVNETLSRGSLYRKHYYGRY
tara:strand:+ start:44 stop:322 length:279 start_codon:yes stop_codon:yes gene_type:complete